MTIRSRLILPLLLAVVCTAQDDPGTLGQSHPARQSAKPQPPIVSMSFRGGSMAEFVAAIRAAEPKSNIVVQGAAASARVPAMELKLAGLDQVLESACAASTSEDRIQCSESRGNGEPVFAIIARPVMQAGPVTASNAAKPQTMVLSLNRLTEGDKRWDVPGLKVETILSAVEAGSFFPSTASTVGSEQKPPLMRYHQDSGLLFLRGNREQLGLANDVLKILERDQQERVKQASANKRAGNQAPSSGPDKDNGR